MARPALEPVRDGADDRLERAILRTRAYFSLFGYTPTLFELHRYLHGELATLEQVRAACRRLPRIHTPAGVHGSGQPLWRTGLYHLEAPAFRLRSLIARLVVGFRLLSRLGWMRSKGTLKKKRPEGRGFAGQAAAVRPCSPATTRRLCFYIALLKHFPFVRMIGLTGSKAVHPDYEGDSDVMIVTEPGRVWLCRLAAVALARIARRFGDNLCPNYVVSNDCLILPEVSIYDAHELAQLVPLYGRVSYHRLWDLNPCAWDLLPNAHPFPCPSDRLLPGTGPLKQALEWALGGRLGDRVERWERTRKIARLRALGGASPEISLTAEQCKGHFDGHKSRILSAYNQLLSRLEGA